MSRAKTKDISKAMVAIAIIMALAYAAFGELGVAVVAVFLLLTAK